MRLERGVEHQLADIPLEQALCPRIDLRRQVRVLDQDGASGFAERGEQLRKMVMPV